MFIGSYSINIFILHNNIINNDIHNTETYNYCGSYTKIHYIILSYIHVVLNSIDLLSIFPYTLIFMILREVSYIFSV